MGLVGGWRSQHASKLLDPDTSRGDSWFGRCAISRWEVAKLVELLRLQLACPVKQWLSQALQPPVQLLPLTPEVAVESTQLPGNFHRDPTDQIIVGTARLYGCPLVTLDRLIRAYSHVQLAP